MLNAPKASHSYASRTYRYVGTYLAFVREANRITAEGATFKISWCGPRLDATAWRREFIAALNGRINSKGGLVKRGKKDCSDFICAAWRDQRAIREMTIGIPCAGSKGTGCSLKSPHRHKIRHYQLQTNAARKRFKHLLASYEDF